MILPIKYLHGVGASVEKTALQRGKDNLFDEVRLQLYKKLCDDISKQVKFNIYDDEKRGRINFSVEVFVLSREEFFELYNDIKKEVEKDLMIINSSI